MRHSIQIMFGRTSQEVLLVLNNTSCKTGSTGLMILQNSFIS